MTALEHLKEVEKAIQRGPALPSPDYKYLGIGDATEDGDMYYDEHSNRWLFSVCRELKVGEHNSLRYCRKVKGEQAQPQVAVPPIEPGAGYRLLGDNETVEEGDEVYYGNRWIPSSRAGYRAGDAFRSVTQTHTYRRKMKVKDTGPAKPKLPNLGHRYLEPGEKLIPTDQYYDPVAGIWVRTREAGRTLLDVAKRVYCRSIEDEGAVTLPGVEYEYLRVGDTIAEGDLYYSSTEDDWVETIWRGRQIQTFDCIYCRRKVEAKPKIEIGEGYVELKPGTILAKGDEFWCMICNAWDPVKAGIGSPGYLTLVYRRKVEKPKPEIGEGYRQLAPGTIREAGDEFWIPSRKCMFFAEDRWVRTTGVGKPIIQAHTYRRKIAYKFRQVGEMTQEGDEYYSPSTCVWKPVMYFGKVNETYAPVRYLV